MVGCMILRELSKLSQCIYILPKYIHPHQFSLRFCDMSVCSCDCIKVYRLMYFWNILKEMFIVFLIIILMGIITKGPYLYSTLEASLCNSQTCHLNLPCFVFWGNVFLFILCIVWLTLYLSWESALEISHRFLLEVMIQKKKEKKKSWCNSIINGLDYLFYLWMVSQTTTTCLAS